MQLPGYELFEVLGRGGMGVVYKARQVHLDRWVALKMILAGADAGPEELARFRIEAQAAARLDHPNIVRIFDFGEVDGQPYFSMEFVPGASLRASADRPWHPATAARLVQTLAGAIHHAHEQQVIHRDLKPANVLMHRDGLPKITDFGLAKKLDSDLDLTATGRLLGTVQYMSPEQATGDSAAIGPPTDVHALGLILYQLLTGRPAFHGKTLLETLESVRSQEPTSPRIMCPEVPTELEAICVRCLQKDPERRFATAQQLAATLQVALDNASAAPAPPPIVTDDPEDGGRSQWWRS